MLVTSVATPEELTDLLVRTQNMLVSYTFTKWHRTFDTKHPAKDLKRLCLFLEKHKALLEAII